MQTINRKIDGVMSQIQQHLDKLSADKSDNAAAFRVTVHAKLHAIEDCLRRGYEPDEAESRSRSVRQCKADEKRAVQKELDCARDYFSDSQ